MKTNSMTPVEEISPPDGSINEGLPAITTEAMPTTALRAQQHRKFCGLGVHPQVLA